MNTRVLTLTGGPYPRPATHMDEIEAMQRGVTGTDASGEYQYIPATDRCAGCWEPLGREWVRISPNMRMHPLCWQATGLPPYALTPGYGRDGGAA